MTRWPACCSGDSLLISACCDFRADSWAAVGTAAAPWTARAAACAPWLPDGAGVLGCWSGACAAGGLLDGGWLEAGELALPLDPQPATTATAPGAKIAPAWRRRPRSHRN